MGGRQINFFTLLYASVACLLTNITAFPNWSSSTNDKSSLIMMKWSFGKGSGSMSEVGGIGPQGEYYFIPSKTPTLRAPPHALGKEGVIPIFPRNQVLGPLGEEYLGIYEMRYRQLLYDIGDGGVFGHAYYSQENSKLALVGTLTKVKRMERLDDGGIYVVMEGIGRFFVKNVISEKPYLKARVQTFSDFTENETQLSSLEQAILDEVRYSVKIMKLLYPQNNYTLNELVIKNRPFVNISDRRSISLESMMRELKRRSSFSFAVMDMLKTDAVTKLLFLQEPVIEKRNARILKVLQDSTVFLEGEILKRGIVKEEKLKAMKQEAIYDMNDLDNSYTISAWLPPQDSKTGELKMNPSLMD